MRSIGEHLALATSSEKARKSTWRIIRFYSLLWLLKMAIKNGYNTLVIIKMYQNIQFLVALIGTLTPWSQYSTFLLMMPWRHDLLDGEATAAKNYRFLLKKGRRIGRRKPAETEPKQDDRNRVGVKWSTKIRFEFALSFTSQKVLCFQWQKYKQNGHLLIRACTSIFDLIFSTSGLNEHLRTS